MEGLRKEVEMQVEAQRKMEHEETMKCMIAVEEEHKSLRESIKRLKQEIVNKDCLLQNYAKEIAVHKIKLSQLSVKLQYVSSKEGNIARMHSDDLDFERFERDVASKHKVNKKTQECSPQDLLAYSCCIAAALEDFLY